MANTRAARSAHLNGVTRRLKISSDSEGSVASKVSRNKMPVVSPDPSSSTSLRSLASSKLINGSSKRAGPSKTKVAQIKSSSSDDEDEVDVGGSSPGESQPESANVAPDDVNEEESADEDVSEEEIDSDDHSDDEDYGTKMRSKRPARAATKRKVPKTESDDSGSTIEPQKRPKRSVPIKKPSSGRNRRQLKAVSYQEFSEEEVQVRKSSRTKNRICIPSDSGGEEEEDDENEQPAVSVSSRGRIRKLTEKGRSVFD
ncbi:uncharacterized protein LOC132197727 [Neocloeon triangulifer]|uniref:uncharacterized protein LOC132197727 n=1 Tax=Neocloeon triangulifer TaxID=2078957 RepID=UPI00286F6412|nr:uncharacterized protein LOC132197727 [Neocloeon triangulifer]